MSADLYLEGAVLFLVLIGLPLLWMNRHLARAEREINAKRAAWADEERRKYGR